MSSRFDAIIVGSGVSGLSAARSLQMAGRSVLVLEAGKQFGGMLNPFARRNFSFEVGVHWIGEAGAGQFMQKAVERLGLHELKFRAVGLDRYCFGEFNAQLVSGIDAWTDLLVADFPHEERGLRAFARFLKNCEWAFQVMRERPTMAEAMRAARNSYHIASLFRGNAGQLVSRFFRDPKLKTIVCAPAHVFNMVPDQVAGFHYMQLLLHDLAGAYFPLGGGGGMRDAFVDVLRRGGADLRRNAVVTKISRTTDKRFLVHTKDAVFEGATVISSAGGQETFALLENERPDWWSRRKGRELRPTSSAFMLYVGTNLDIRKLGMDDANIVHFGTSDFGKLIAAHALAIDGKLGPESIVIYLSSPTLKDPDGGGAPANSYALEIITGIDAERFRPWVGKPVMKRGEDYEAMKDTISDRLLSAAERYLPGLREHVVVQDAATPATLWSFVRATNGAYLGPEASPDQTFVARFLPSTGIPGFYLAGASTMSGPGVMPCMMSGFWAAKLAENHLRKRPRLVLPLFFMNMLPEA